MEEKYIIAKKVLW